MLWPNSDAGGDDISRGIRVFREHKNPEWLHLFKNLPTQIYIHLMNTCSCLIGNSSSGVREGAFIGTPVVNIGTRQNGREHGQNVTTVSNTSSSILNGIKKQLKIEKYPIDKRFGDGKSGKKVANILSKIEVKVQKKFFKN